MKDIYEGFNLAFPVQTIPLKFNSHSPHLWILNHIQLI